MTSTSALCTAGPRTTSLVRSSRSVGASVSRAERSPRIVRRWRRSPVPRCESDESVGQPWPGLVDRLEGAIAAIDSVRDSLLGTYDIHMGRVSQHANDVMKTLTLLSGVLLPAVVLAGIMGMNFAMPFFEDTTNFWIVLAAMIGMAVVILAVARWRDWI